VLPILVPAGALALRRIAADNATLRGIYQENRGARVRDIERLGRAGAEVAPQPSRAPVPDWLAERLVQTAGVASHVVAAMDADQAFEVWTAFCSRPGP